MPLHIKFFIALASSIILTSCCGVSSSFHYTRGTTCLSSGDYQGAILELNKAVDSNPDMARNHTNLATAYYAAGNTEKGWYHCRQAVRCRYTDGLCDNRFVVLCKEKIYDAGLGEEGVSWETIRTALGEPDELYKNNKGCIEACCYGTFIFKFQEGKLTESGLSTRY